MADGHETDGLKGISYTGGGGGGGGGLALDIEGQLTEAGGSGGAGDIGSGGGGGGGGGRYRPPAGQVTAAVALHHGGGGAGGCSTGGGDGGGGLGGEGGGCGAELSMEGQVSAPPGLAKRSGSAPAERLMIRGGGGGSEDAGCSTAAEAGGCSGSTGARRPRQAPASINVPAEGALHRVSGARRAATYYGKLFQIENFARWGAEPGQPAACDKMSLTETTITVDKHGDRCKVQADGVKFASPAARCSTLHLR